MHSHLFSPSNLAILTHPDRWRFVATAFANEVAPARRCAHDAWTRAHVDTHPHREILIPLSGRGYYGFGGRSYPTRPGVVFLFDAMEPHDYRYPPGHTPANHLWFHFTRGQCGVALMRIGGRAGHRVQWQRSYLLSDLGLASVQALFPDADSAIPRECQRHRCAAALALLISSLVGKGCQPQPAVRVADVQADVIQAVVRHIHESHGHGCQLQNLARIAGYSKYHFLRLFRERAGMSLRRCVDDARASGFRQMTAAHLPLKVISHKLGFAHPSALCRWRRQQGLP